MVVFKSCKILLRFLSRRYVQWTFKRIAKALSNKLTVQCDDDITHSIYDRRQAYREIISNLREWNHFSSLLTILQTQFFGFPGLKKGLSVQKRLVARIKRSTRPLLFRRKILKPEAHCLIPENKPVSKYVRMFWTKRHGTLRLHQRNLSDFLVASASLALFSLAWRLLVLAWRSFLLQQAFLAAFAPWPSSFFVLPLFVSC